MAPRVLALKSATTQLEDHRLLIGALLGGVDTTWPLDRRQGVLHTGGDPAALSGSGMTATIAPFAAIVTGASSPTQGPYLVVETEDTPVLLGDGLATGTRTDQIGLVIRDNVYDGSGEDGSVSAEIRVIDPAADFSYLPLYSVDVPQGAAAGTGGIPWASAVTDLRTHTSTHGGVITVPDLAARNRMTRIRPGTLCHVEAGHALYQFHADGWRPIAGQPFIDELITLFERRPGAWQNVQMVSGVTGSVQVRRTPDGLVYMRGTFTLGPRDGGWSSEIIGRVPAGFEPPVLVRWSTASTQSGGYNASRLEVRTNGDIHIYTVYTPSWVSGDNVTYWTV